MKKVLDVFKKPLWLLCLGLGIVLFASIFANMANTSAYKVSVTEVSFETEHGNMTGLLYKPRSCTAENPCATIVTTHGYLNTKEMQDAPAIELSKRGYVVLAMDMYDHGDSTWDSAEYGSFMFFRWSQYDAVTWAAKQDFVLKSEKTGAAMIAVSGHSMGGFSSRVATYMDSVDMAKGENQKIVAALPVGADFSYVSWGLGMAEFAYIDKMTPNYLTDDNGELILDVNGKKQYILTPDATNPLTYILVDLDGNGTKETKVSATPSYTTPGTDKVIATDAEARRTMGTIAGQYDEFFFNPDGNKGGTVKEKDYTTTTEGAKFYYAEDYNGRNPEFKEAEWNEEAYNGGGSVIYVPNEIHPWNHFSTESTAYMIDFYDKAFETQFEIHEITENDGVVAYKDGTAQSWWLKEGFECIALIGMFIAITAAVALFATLPFFKRVTTAGEEINEVSRPTGPRALLMKGFLILSCAATAYVYPMILEGTTEAYTESVKAIMWGAALVFIAAIVASVIVKAVKGEDENASKVINFAVFGAAAVFAASFFSYWTLTNTFFADSTYYNEPTTNVIAYWALVSASLTLIALTISYFLSNKKDGYTCANYGLKANWKQILMALLIAVCVVAGVYVLTFVIEVLLRVDFRVWTYAIKPFAGRHFIAFLKYLPVFFLFYLVNGISVVANTGHDRTWKGTLKAVLIGAAGVAILLGVHYGMDFATGTAKYPNQALNMILVWALVPTLAIAAWITRKSYLKTGNIWTGVFINAILFTLIQVANTTLYLM